MRSVKYSIPIYGADLILVISQDDTLKEDLKKLNIKTFPDDVSLNIYDAIAFSEPYKSGESRYIIIMVEDISNGTVAHECNHIVNWIFKDRGIVNINNDEPASYLLGWMVNKVHYFKDKKQQK